MTRLKRSTSGEHEERGLLLLPIEEDNPARNPEDAV
jgi:hypothetical protein